ncbi:MAG TPA: hypothetical protein VN794_16135, partial [Methylomirabilota bacterium]|nr:hypothetical protein [Methylomirabilota bacterium]
MRENPASARPSVFCFGGGVGFGGFAEPSLSRRPCALPEIRRPIDYLPHPLEPPTGTALTTPATIPGTALLCF